MCAQLPAETASRVLLHTTQLMLEAGSARHVTPDLQQENQLTATVTPYGPFGVVDMRHGSEGEDKITALVSPDVALRLEVCSGTGALGRQRVSGRFADERDWWLTRPRCLKK